MSAQIQALTRQPPELDTIGIEVEGETVILTLNRPDRFNSMSPEMIEEMPVAFSWLADLSGARAAIITGAGRAFSAGGDVTWFAKGIDSSEREISAEVRRGADVLHQAIIDLRRVPFPVVAAINGPAAGAGLSLALACDLRIAGESAMLACAYGRIGASPDGGLTWLLPRVVGPSRAIELLLGDPNLSAEQALSERLVTEVVADAELAGRAREQAAELAALSPHYVRMAKELVGAASDRGLADHLQAERHGIADAMRTEDARVGVKAFLAGEQPEFRGR